MLLVAVLRAGRGRGRQGLGEVLVVVLRPVDRLETLLLVVLRPVDRLPMLLVAVLQPR